VTLTGTVRERQDKRRIEELVESLSGVDDVKNEIRVKRETASTSTTGTTGIGSTSTSSTDDRNGRTMPRASS